MSWDLTSIKNAIADFHTCQKPMTEGELLLKVALGGCRGKGEALRENNKIKPFKIEPETLARIIRTAQPKVGFYESYQKWSSSHAVVRIIAGKTLLEITPSEQHQCVPGDGPSTGDGPSNLEVAADYANQTRLTEKP